MIAGREGVLCLAFVVDLALGEPPERWHPVCWIGRAVEIAERPFSGSGTPEALKRIAGIVTAVTLPVGVYVASRTITRTLPHPLRYAAEVLGIWSALATRSLYGSAMAVEEGLRQDLEAGRERVAAMVGRDTGKLDATGVARAAVESVAENANDGVVAPLFFAVAGGAPLALAYKAVNTLDSMVGYRDERHRSFGWASARLDDAAGYLPARVTGAAVIAASALTGGSPREAARTWKRDAGSHASPNAGVCESAFAGALGVRLGGGDSVGGVARERAVIGAGMRPVQAGDIARAARLMIAVAMTALAWGMAVMRIGSGMKRFFATGGGDGER